MNGERNTRQSAGFTLIELVVVLAVLAALGAVIIPQVQQLRTEVALKNAASSLASATEHSFAVQLKSGSDWPNQWMVSKTPEICNSLNNLSSSLRHPTATGGSYAIEIPSGYSVAPARSASSGAVTFSVPNATGRSADSPTTNVTCALVED